MSSETLFVSPVKGSIGEWNHIEGLRAFGTPNPSLSNVAHEGLRLLTKSSFRQHTNPLYGSHRKYGAVQSTRQAEKY